MKAEWKPQFYEDQGHNLGMIALLLFVLAPFVFSVIGVMSYESAHPQQWGFDLKPAICWTIVIVVYLLLWALLIGACGWDGLPEGLRLGGLIMPSVFGICFFVFGGCGMIFGRWSGHVPAECLSMGADIGILFFAAITLWAISRG